MSTTNLVVEIVIIGVQVSLWLGCFLLTFSLEWVQSINLSTAKDWLNLILVVLFAVAYPLGIAVDRLSDQFFRCWNNYDPESPQQAEFDGWCRFIVGLIDRLSFWRKVKRTSQFEEKKISRLNNKKKVKRDLQRMMIYMNEGTSTTLIDYPRSRLRIARATTLNATLIGISISLFVLVNGTHLSIVDESKWIISAVALLSGFVVSGFSIYAAIEVQVTEEVRTELITCLIPHKGKDGWDENFNIRTLSAQIANNRTSEPIGDEVNKKE